ncbi:MAG TPA: MOSC domain-containing protein [Thermoleophilaceae bacterium]|nr:MOSC domain-containing protein [Thermoleophilaceae bacterium]
MAVVEGIFFGAIDEGPLEPADAVEVKTGAGIEGDRYGDKDITLFEAEAIEGLTADTGIELKPSEIRRNVMTRGIALNDLLGHRIRVGEVEAVVTELCHPCSHLQKLTQPGVLRGLVNRGGLNADVVSGGAIRVGDQIEDLGPAEHSSTRE